MRARRASGSAGSTLPSSLFPLPLFVLALSCTSITTRPNIQPFPMASVDTLVGDPAGVLGAAREAVGALGMQVGVASAAEGYLETRWFDVITHQSRRSNTNPERLVRMRVWTDLVTPSETQVVVETVYRSTIDPSVPDREVELVTSPGTAGDSLTQA